VTKRHLFAELKNGMDALAAAREGKQPVKTTEFDASEYLDSAEVIAAYLREAFESGEEGMVDAAIADVEKAVPLRPIKTNPEYDRAVMFLNGILDGGGADEKHRLSTLANSLGEFISQYESTHGL